MSTQRYSRRELIGFFSQWFKGEFNEKDFQEWLLDEEYYQDDDSAYYVKDEEV